MSEPQATDAEALAFAAKTLRAWTYGDALVNPAGAVKAMHSAADLLDQLAAGLISAQQAIAKTNEYLDDWHAELTARIQQAEADTAAILERQRA